MHEAEMPRDAAAATRSPLSRSHCLSLSLSLSRSRPLSLSRSCPLSLSLSLSLALSLSLSPFMITNIKHKLTNLCGNRLLPNDFMDNLCEVSSGADLARTMEHADFVGSDI